MFRRGVARGLPSGAFQFWFVFLPAAPSYGVHGARAALPVGFVSSHLYRVKALRRLFGSRSSSRHGLLMTYGYLRLACSPASDDPRGATSPASFLVVATRLQDSVHTTRQRARDGRLVGIPLSLPSTLIL